MIYYSFLRLLCQPCGHRRCCPRTPGTIPGGSRPSARHTRVWLAGADRPDLCPRKIMVAETANERNQHWRPTTDAVPGTSRPTSPFAMHHFSHWVFIRSYGRWRLALPIHLALDELVELTVVVFIHYMPGVFTDLASTYSSIQRP